MVEKPYVDPEKPAYHISAEERRMSHPFTSSPIHQRGNMEDSGDKKVAGSPFSARTRMKREGKALRKKIRDAKITLNMKDNNTKLAVELSDLEYEISNLV